MLSQNDKTKLHAKVLREYGRAEAHTRTWKEEVKDLGREYLLPKPGQDKVKIRKVLNNLQIRLATFLSDEIQVTNIPMNGVKGKHIAQNANKVFDANFTSMSIRNKYRDVLIDDAMQGVGVLAVDGWNDYKQEPIVSYIDSRLTYPDPKNWQDNCMQFFGTKVRKSWYELMEDEAYDQEALKMCKAYVDSDQKEIDRANNNVKGFQEDLNSSEDQTDLYNHLTIFKSEEDDKPCVYLTTWGNGQSILVRCVKIRALTPGEQADPSTVDFGVKLFRAKPLKGSYAGVSLIDDIGQFQDIETLLSNLQIRQSQLAALGGKTYINTALGVDLDDASNNTGPGDIIPFTSANPQINAQNGIYQEPNMQVNPAIQNTIQYLNNLSQQSDPASTSIAQGISTPGSQTKAEIQTLQQNINQVLSYMSSNYLEALKGLWESIYRSYASNMSPQRRKDIVVVDEGGRTDAYGLKKREFVTDGEVYIKIKSKAQEDIRQKQDFTVLLSVYGSLKGSLQPGSVEDIQLDRKLIELSGIKGLEPEQLKPMTADERKAYQNLELLNDDEELKTKPQAGEDHNVYINIYKTGLDTPARTKAINAREKAIMQEPKQAPQAPTQPQGGVAQQLGASMLSAQNAQGANPSLADVN